MYSTFKYNDDSDDNGDVDNNNNDDDSYSHNVENKELIIMILGCALNPTINKHLPCSYQKHSLFYSYYKEMI